MKFPKQNRKDHGRLEDKYYHLLDQLLIPYQLMNIETSFGDTHIVLIGPKDKPPLVLLHQEQSNAALVVKAFKNLLQNFRVYAIDIISDHTSTQFVLRKTDTSYGQWMFEVITRLNITGGTLVGLNKGGFIAWKSLHFLKSRITSAFLIDPEGIIAGENYPVITLEEAQCISTPLYMIATTGPPSFAGRKLLAQAKTIFSSLVATLLLDQTSLTSSVDRYERITHFIKIQL